VGIIGWIILGLLAGAIAKVILPGDAPGGIIVTMLIGIAGAIIGGLIASALNLGDLGDLLRHRHLDHRHPRLAAPPSCLPRRDRPTTHLSPHPAAP